MEGHIWVYDLNRGTETPLTAEGMSEYAAWTPDGRRVAFEWVSTGVPNIYWQAVDGSSPMERLTQSEILQYPVAWSQKERRWFFSKPARTAVMTSYPFICLSAG
jgi:Tol biopolymer transport system component